MVRSLRTAFLYVSTLAVLCGGETVLAASPNDQQPPLVLLSNRCPHLVQIRLPATDGSTIERRLAPLDNLALPVTGVVPLEFSTQGQPQRYGISPSGIYCFAIAEGGRVDLTRIDLQANPQAPPPANPTVGAVDRDKLTAVTTIPVKIFVDDNEVTRREVWEPRLRRRIEAANEILKASAGIELKIIDAGIWRSDNKITEFEETLQEFEREVRPAPAALAIGFTSQYSVRAGRQKLGGTRAPLHPYLLVREYGPRINERERLEVLIHELGHFLGAVHSPERDSVMRPLLGDDQVNLRRFRIVFDPVNALAINLFAQQWRDRKVRSLDQIDSPTRAALSSVYQVLAQAVPDDPAAPLYLRYLSASDFSTAQRGAAAVLEAVAAADSKPPGGAPLETSDERAQRYIRAAAALANRLPSESPMDAFLLGTAIGLGDTLPPALAAGLKQPLLSARPTFYGQQGLLQRFVTTAALAGYGGPDATQGAVLARLAHQLRNGGSYKPAEVAAELAGIRFATRLKRGDVTLAEVAAGFRIDQFLPPPSDDEALPAGAFEKQFGSVYDARFEAEMERLQRPIPNM